MLAHNVTQLHSDKSFGFQKWLDFNGRKCLILKLIWNTIKTFQTVRVSCKPLEISINKKIMHQPAEHF